MLVYIIMIIETQCHKVIAVFYLSLLFRFRVGMTLNEYSLSSCETSLAIAVFQNQLYLVLLCAFSLVL